MYGQGKILTGLFIFLSVYVYPLFAEAPNYVKNASFLVQSVEEKVRKQFGDDTLQRIHDYGIEIQKNAYEITMQLCPAYRVAIGMGLPDYHKKFNNSYYVHHQSPEVRSWALQMNNEYGEDLSSSLQAWLYVMYEGGVQSFLALFETGIKGDYINVTHKSFFEVRRWFQSMYTLYLVDSLGFSQAAMHCLNTVTDADAINQFTYAVLGVDIYMSTVGYVAMIWTGEQVFGVIVQGIRWASRPLARGFVKWLHRMNISTSTVKRYAVISGVTALGGLGIWTVDSIQESQESQEHANLLGDGMQEEVRQRKEENHQKE